jgi:hypothetical protein
MRTSHDQHLCAHLHCSLQEVVCRPKLVVNNMLHIIYIYIHTYIYVYIYIYTHVHTRADSKDANDLRASGLDVATPVFRDWNACLGEGRGGHTLEVLALVEHQTHRHAHTLNSHAKYRLVCTTRLLQVLRKSFASLRHTCNSDFLITCRCELDAFDNRQLCNDTYNLHMC